MKRIIFGIVFFLLLTGPLLAAFCSECGQKLTEGVKFCPGCGTKLSAPATTKRVPEITLPKPPSPEKKPLALKTYRTKTELYVYEKRGDEQNILKKNLFFKPRRSKLPRNTRFQILEEFGPSCLVQSLPEPGEKVQKGWVMQSELLHRTDWEKK